LHPCNYNDVIVPYHIPVAQGGNADTSSEGQTQMSRSTPSGGVRSASQSAPKAPQSTLH